MFNTLKKLISETIPTKFSGNDITPNNHIKRVQIATCALLLEIANIDGEFSQEERKKVISIIQRTFEISEDYVHELIELAEEDIKDSVSIYEFTTLVNDYFTQDEKFEIMINLWKLIFADDVLDAHEDHLVKRIGSNLKFGHREIIEAKLIAKTELGKA